MWVKANSLKMLQRGCHNFLPQKSNVAFYGKKGEGLLSSNENFDRMKKMASEGLSNLIHLPLYCMG